MKGRNLYICVFSYYILYTVINMGLPTQVMEKNKEFWSNIFHKLKGDKKAEKKEKPRTWKH